MKFLQGKEKSPNMSKKEYTLLGRPWESDAEEAEGEDNSKNIEELENYKYFHGTEIRNSAKIIPETFKKGERLCQHKKIRVDRFVNGYDRDSGEIRGQMDAIGQSGEEEFLVQVVFSRNRVVNMECGCTKCRRSYFSWYSRPSDCAYKAGALILLEEYLNTHNLGDATDQAGYVLLNLFQSKRANQVLASTSAEKESMRLLPRLTRKNGKLSVAFKVGGTKLFIVKKLDEFCRNVRESATAVYGTNTQLNHSLDNFNAKGKEWVRFISRIVREEQEFQQRALDANNYAAYRKAGIGSELNLFGWRLDEFYKMISEDGVDFEDKEYGSTKKGTLTCGRRNPKITMQISAEKERLGEISTEKAQTGKYPVGKDPMRKNSMGKTRKADMPKEFHGIRAEGTFPTMYYGTDSAYYIDHDQLNQIDQAFMDKIRPLASLAVEDHFLFHVGRNHMSEFYYRVLPSLQDTIDIIETEPDEFRSYLLPEARFAFYLDAEEKNVTCEVYARYGEKEVAVLDIMSKREEGGVEAFRDAAREEEILFHAMQLFPEVDWQKGELHCGGDEELIYQVMEKGTEELMQLGEVQCTKRFLGYHAVKRVKVSVGVSVSSGLLELNILTDDISRNELLDILNSYRAKKKYFRLKDGSFVGIENDSSLEMLAELMAATHLKPKDFVQGKMHLPMYRTLYLDKMLEEHESVYSNRDSHFREVVKGFKTVKDADFEEPESLAGIMRKYQKDGYKWLRTVESWQFGGILADDMGLGKTLQVIAVLLAAKQEGKEGTSLVVTPASLIFNWGEEFRRFAPELRISLVMGTQEERQRKIEAYREADVLVTSYDLLKRDILMFEGKPFLYEIIDEAQYIKNHTTAAAKSVKLIQSQIRFALTGTPIENRLSELWSIFDYLMPGFLYGYDIFKREIETPAVKNQDEAAMKRLQKMIGPFILRRLKEDVLKDLPEKLEECRYVRLGDAQQKLYDGQVLRMKEKLMGQGEEEFNKNKLQILAELTRLRQICCDPSLCFENYGDGAAKLEACLQLIQSAIDGGHRMLVFSQFTSMLDILQQSLDREGIPYYMITGNTSKEKRLQMVKEFNEGDVPVFLISLKAGGVGLNLIGADMVIHYDPWWNLAVQNQATDRAHRIGQTKKVMVYKLIAKNTIEEKIQELQEAKRNLAEQVMDGQAAQLGSLSREEMLELLEA